MAPRAAALMLGARVEVITGGWNHSWLADAPTAGQALRDFLAAHNV